MFQVTFAPLNSFQICFRRKLTHLKMKQISETIPRQKLVVINDKQILKFRIIFQPPLTNMRSSEYLQKKKQAFFIVFTINLFYLSVIFIFFLLILESRRISMLILLETARKANFRLVLVNWNSCNRQEKEEQYQEKQIF